MMRLNEVVIKIFKIDPNLVFNISDNCQFGDFRLETPRPLTDKERHDLNVTEHPTGLYERDVGWRYVGMVA